MRLLVPEDVVQAMEEGELSSEQLEVLIGWEAVSLGLTIEEAIRRARERTLPDTPAGNDLEFLIDLLPSH